MTAVSTSLGYEAHKNATNASMLERLGALAYGAINYMIFFGVFLYAIGFLVGFAVPVSLDTLPGGPFTSAFLINFGLLGMFAIQHSVMARPTFKRWITQFIPVHLERSTYVLFSNLAMIAIFVFWQPMGGVVWTAEDSVVRTVLYALGISGFALVFYCTVLLNHFDLFGLRQVWLFARGRKYTALKFETPALYSLVRHPLYVGWIMSFWFAPTMTVAHLVFAVISTLYILVAIQLEERNLIEEHGDSYRAYRRRVPMLIPFTKLSRSA